MNQSVKIRSLNKKSFDKRFLPRYDILLIIQIDQVWQAQDAFSDWFPKKIYKIFALSSKDFPALFPLSQIGYNFLSIISFRNEMRGRRWALKGL